MKVIKIPIKILKKKIEPIHWPRSMSDCSQAGRIYFACCAPEQFLRIRKPTPSL